jgi:hypothetical protein
VQWLAAIIPATQGVEAEGHLSAELEVNLGNIMKPCFKDRQREQDEKFHQRIRIY